MRAYSIPVEPASVRVCVHPPCVTTLKYEYFHNHQADYNQILTEVSFGMGEKAARRFGPDRIRTLVSMATDSFNRVIMKKIL